LISQRRAGATQFFLFDALGSTDRLTDTTASVTDQYRYDAFGIIKFTSGTTTNPFRYVGKLGYYYDGDLAQYYLRARHYNPVLGRFLSADPLALDSYRYASNNPVNWTDPSGLSTLEYIKDSPLMKFCGGYDVYYRMRVMQPLTIVGYWCVESEWSQCAGLFGCCIRGRTKRAKCCFWEPWFSEDVPGTPNFRIIEIPEDHHQRPADADTCCSSVGKHKREGRFYVFNNPTGIGPELKSLNNKREWCGEAEFDVNAGTEIRFQAPFPPPGINQLPPRNLLPVWLRDLQLQQNESKWWRHLLEWNCCYPTGEKKSFDLIVDKAGQHNQFDDVLGC
jgi:RHS repeat-associated protein